MIEIKWALDEEEGIDPTNPVGDIAITDGTSRIFAEYTYLDSWFDALVRGVRGVLVGQSLTVNIVEEPQPLVFKPLDQGMQISYQNQSIVIPKNGEFVDVIKETAKDFLAKTSNVAGFESNDLLTSLRSFKKIIDLESGYVDRFLP